MTRWRMWRLLSLLHEPVELAGVLADDLPADVRRQVPELALDVLRRIRPDAIGMREIRRPHDIVDPELVEELHADLVGLEGGLALPPPVLARSHAQAEILELILPLEVHAVEDVGDPADPALAEHEGDPRMALQHAPVDHAHEHHGHEPPERRDGDGEAAPDSPEGHG